MRQICSPLGEGLSCEILISLLKRVSRAFVLNIANVTPTVVARQPDILSIPKLYKMQLTTDPEILSYSCSIIIL